MMSKEEVISVEIEKVMKRIEFTNAFQDLLDMYEYSNVKDIVIYQNIYGHIVAESSVIADRKVRNENQIIMKASDVGGSLSIEFNDGENGKILDDFGDCRISDVQVFNTKEISNHTNLFDFTSFTRGWILFSNGEIRYLDIWTYIDGKPMIKFGVVVGNGKSYSVQPCETPINMLYAILQKEIEDAYDVESVEETYTPHFRSWKLDDDVVVTISNFYK